MSHIMMLAHGRAGEMEKLIAKWEDIPYKRAGAAEGSGPDVSFARWREIKFYDVIIPDECVPSFYKDVQSFTQNSCYRRGGRLDHGIKYRLVNWMIRKAFKLIGFETKIGGENIDFIQFKRSLDRPLEEGEQPRLREAIEHRDDSAWISHWLRLYPMCKVRDGVVGGIEQI